MQEPQWAVSPYPPDYPAARDVTWERAAKRLADVVPGPGYFSVRGRSELQDEYAEYRVTQVHHGARRLVCSCKSHLGGESRGAFCTHRMAVVLWGLRQGKGAHYYLTPQLPEVLQVPAPTHYASTVPAQSQVALAPVARNEHSPTIGGTYQHEVAQSQQLNSAAVCHPPVPTQAAAPTPAFTAGLQQLVNHFEQPTQDPNQPIPGWGPPAHFDQLPPRIPSMVHSQAHWCKDVSSAHYADFLRVCLSHYRHENHADAWEGVAPWDIPCIPHPSRYGAYAPPWLKALRQQQWDAVRQIVRLAVERGLDTVYAEMPTGSGKTLLGVLVWRELAMLQVPQLHDPGCDSDNCSGCWEPMKGLYLCTTKQLQDQASEDFPYAVVLKGRSNYPTANFPEQFAEDLNSWVGERLSCGDCVWDSTHCYLCDSNGPAGPEPWSAKDRCPYTQVFRRAMKADLVITNTAYALIAWNRMGLLRGRFVIWDEGDTQEDSLQSFASVELSPGRQKFLGIQPPDKKTVEESWKQWFDGLKPREHTAIRSALELASAIVPTLAAPLNEGLRPLERFGAPQLIRRRLQDIADQLFDLGKTSSKAVRLRREAKSLGDLEEQLKLVREQLSSNWVYTGYDSAKPNPDLRETNQVERHPIEFKPLLVKDLAQSQVWNHGWGFLVESGTLVDPVGLAADMGLQPMDFGRVVVPSNFPVANRPIYYQPIAANIGKTREEKLKAWVPISEYCIELSRHYVANRMNTLIHTVTYDFTRFLRELLERAGIPCVTYDRADQRVAILEQFKRYGGVLLAPSMERGVNLKDDLCRAQIITKVPFPYLGDRMVNLRVNSTGPAGKIWYARQTVQSLAQMYGRPNRSETDWSYTHIVDSQFEVFYRKNRQLFPQFFTEALVMPQTPNSGRRRY